MYPSSRFTTGVSPWALSLAALGVSLLAATSAEGQPVWVPEPGPPTLGAPPAVIVTQEPPPVVVVNAPTRAPMATTPGFPEHRGFAVHAQIGGLLSSNVAMGGIRGALRIRPQMGQFAVDLGMGSFAGVDYNNLERVEVPITADALFFLNPEADLQFYGLAGVGVSFSHATGREAGIAIDRDYMHVGASLGVGTEFFLSPAFAVNADLRGFLRHRVDDDPRPEFVELGPDGRERTSDSSGGVLLSLGATFYF